MLKNKETVAKEFGEKFKKMIEEPIVELDINSRTKDVVAIKIGDGSEFEKIESFIHSQRVADLEAVKGMVKEGQKQYYWTDKKTKEVLYDGGGTCRSCDKRRDCIDPTDLLAKLEEVKGKIR